MSALTSRGPVPRGEPGESAWTSLERAERDLRSARDAASAAAAHRARLAAAARLGVDAVARASLRALDDAGEPVGDEPGGTELARLRAPELGTPHDAGSTGARLDAGPDPAGPIVRRRIALLRERGVALDEPPEGDPIDRLAVAIAADGVRVLVDPASGAMATPLGLHAEREAAARLLGGAPSAEGGASEAPDGIVVAGLLPPEALERALDAAAPTGDGHRPRVTLVHDDPATLRTGLALLASDGPCTDPRVEWIVGEGASDRFASVLEERLSCKTPGVVVGARGASADPAPVIRAARAAQSRRADELTERVVRRSADRDAAYWAARYRAALAPGSAEPLRAIVVSCRYSTFVRHSARDIASALRRMGHTAELVEEPTASDRMTTLSALEPFARLDPDLVLLINFTRASLPGVSDARVPTVCWIQDRLVHLFDKRVGAAQRVTDFMLGHAHPALFELHGWDRRNALFSSVPACAERFHDGPADPSLESELACDIAYIGHQSEPPEAAHERLRGTIAADERMRGVLDDAAARVMRIVRDGDPDRRSVTGPPCYMPPATVAADALRRAGMADPPADLADKLQALHVAVVAERAFRHRRLEWVAEIAERHGLRFRIFGRGWSAHPTLGRYAACELDHAEPLRAAYRAAAVHLHASLNTNAHQRVAECALSGGLVLRAAPSPDAHLIHLNILNRLLETREPDARARRGDLWFTLEPSDEPDAPCARRLRRLRFRPEPEHPDHDACALRVPAEFAQRDGRSVPRARLSQFPDYAFDDGGGSTFCTAADLERSILRAVRDRAWRARTVAVHREAARRGMTYDRALADLFAHMSARLASASGGVA